MNVTEKHRKTGWYLPVFGFAYRCCETTKSELCEMYFFAYGCANAPHYPTLWYINKPHFFQPLQLGHLINDLCFTCTRKLLLWIMNKNFDYEMIIAFELINNYTMTMHISFKLHKKTQNHNNVSTQPQKNSRSILYSTSTYIHCIIVLS